MKLLRLHFGQELHRHTALSFREPLDPHDLGEVLAVLWITGHMVGNGHVQSHPFSVSADFTDEIDAFARNILCDVRLFEGIVGIGYTNLHGLADADATASALIG